MNCPVCNAHNESGARFCNNCGASLPSADTPVSPKPNTQQRKRRPYTLMVAAAVAVVLITIIIAIGVTAYWLTNHQLADDTITIGNEGGTVNLANNVQLTIPPEGLTGPLKLRSQAIAISEFAATEPDAVKQFPTHFNLNGNVYRFEVDGEAPASALITIPTQAEELDTVDLMGWDGATWRRLPFRVDPTTTRIVAEMDSLPSLLALGKAEPSIPLVTAQLPAETEWPTISGGELSELLLSGFYLQPDGSIAVEAPAAGQVSQTAAIIPTLRNWRTDGTSTADMGNILGNPVTRQRHLNAIVGLALSAGFPAIHLDYRGMGPIHRAYFAEFVTDLAAALHEQERTLLVRVSTPVQVSASSWDTGAYDWGIISQAADRLLTPLPVPLFVSEQGQTAFLNWAVGQADRTKIQPIVSFRPLLPSGDQLATLSASEVVAELGPLQAVTSESVSPGDRITLSLAGLTDGGVLEQDPGTGLLHFVAPKASIPTNEWYLPTAHSLTYQLQRLTHYNVAGVMLDDLFDTPDQLVWAVLPTYLSQTKPTPASDPAWVWTITNAAEIVLQDTLPLAETEFHWTAPETPGEYQVALRLSPDGGDWSLPVAALTFTASPPSTSTPTPKPTNSAAGDTLVNKKPTPTKTPTTPTPTATPATPQPTVAPPRPSRSFLLAYTKWDGYFHNLYIADSGTRQEQLVLTHASGPSFSTDGQKLFFIGEQGVDQQTRQDWVACSFGTISEGVVAVDLTSPVKDICQVQDGGWTCDRKQIDIGLGPSDVCTANGVSVYQNLDWKVGSARWTRVSPTDDSVAFDAKIGPDYRIYFRAVAPTSQQSHFEIPGEQGAWSPDGERLVYRSGRNNQVGLWISNRDDSGATRITDNGTDSFPIWSPDGSRIAFHRDVDGDVEILTVKPDGSDLRRLTDARGPDTLPVYTPDGQIVFRSGRNDNWGIWIMEGDGSNQTLLVPNAPVSHIDWASDRMAVQ